MKEFVYGYDRIPKPFFIEKKKFTTPRNMLTNHFHDAYEIYYLMDGERYYFIREHTYHIKKGDLVLIDMNDLHKTLDAGVPVHERILVNFKKEYLSSLLSETKEIDILSCFHKKLNVLNLNLREQNHVLRILNRMHAEDINPREDSGIYIKLLLTELIIFANRQFETQPATHVEYLSPIHKKITEIVVYINSSYMEDLTLPYISNRFSISKFYLSRTFKEVTGFTFLEYLNNIRIKEAENLLRKTKLSMPLIAERVGFQSITQFGRVFKTITGVSPLRFRKEN